MRRFALPLLLVPGLLPLILAGCHQGYSANTYASNAAQQEAAVQRGVIIGVRQVLISATGTVGAATGGAVGGVAGSQFGAGPVTTALGAIGGTLVGGIGGAAAAQAVADTKGWEYIVQEAGDKLVSVTQTSKTALPAGLHVLVIADSQQARIVPDYTIQTPPPPPGSTATEIRVDPLLPAAGVQPMQVAPIPPVNDPTPPPGGPAPTPPPSGGAAAATPGAP